MLDGVRLQWTRRWAWVGATMATVAFLLPMYEWGDRVSDIEPSGSETLEILHRVVPLIVAALLFGASWIRLPRLQVAVFLLAALGTAARIVLDDLRIPRMPGMEGHGVFTSHAVYYGLTAVAFGAMPAALHLMRHGSERLGRRILALASALLLIDLIRHLMQLPGTYEAHFGSPFATWRDVLIAWDAGSGPLVGLAAGCSVLAGGYVLFALLVSARPSVFKPRYGAMASRAGLCLLPVALIATSHALLHREFPVDSAPIISLGAKEGLRRGAEFVAAGLAIVTWCRPQPPDDPAKHF